MKKKIFVALDTDKINEALNITKEIKDYIAGIKLGLEFFSKNGPEGVKAFSYFNIPIFLDLKLFDIRNTIVKTIKSLDTLQINYLSIHLMNGEDALKAAKKASLELSKPIKLLGVSILTSFSDDNLNEVGINNSINQQVNKLTKIAKKVGLDGIVCSAHEIKLVKNIAKDIEIFVPGIRLKKEQDDQKRIVAPIEAINNGADYLVIGRPITIGNPLENIKEIIKTLN